MDARVLPIHILKYKPHVHQATPNNELGAHQQIHNISIFRAVDDVVVVVIVVVVVVIGTQCPSSSGSIFTSLSDVDDDDLPHIRPCTHNCDAFLPLAKIVLYI